MKNINDLLESQDLVSYVAEEIIFNAGSVADEMYVVIEGSVDIVYNNKVLETLNAGDIFGEMALIDDNPRSATAVAKTDCRVLPINENKFDDLIQSPTVGPNFMLHIMKVMSERIRKLNYLLSR